MIKRQQYGRYALTKALRQVKDTERLAGRSVYSGLPVDELNYGFVFNDFIFVHHGEVEGCHTGREDGRLLY